MKNLISLSFFTRAISHQRWTSTKVDNVFLAKHTRPIFHDTAQVFQEDEIPSSPLSARRTPCLRRVRAKECRDFDWRCSLSVTIRVS